MTQPSVCAICLTADRPQMLARAVRSFREQTYENRMLLIWDSSDPRTVYPDGTFSGRSECETPTAPGGYLLWMGNQDSTGLRNQTVGSLRNAANSQDIAMESDILMHWDDDDWSHSSRIAEQVALLQSSGADAVGYNECLFWYCRLCDRKDCQDPNPHGADGTGAYLYRNPNPCYALGASLAYWRRTWERKPFPDLPTPGGHDGEDKAWIDGIKVCGVSAIPSETDLSDSGSGRLCIGDPRLICSIHGGNTMQATYDKLIRASARGGAQGQFVRVPEWDGYCREAMK